MDKKKGFISKILDKLDGKLEEKTEGSCGCCCEPSKDKKKGCCD